MEIIEYKKELSIAVQNLFTELQEYISAIDREKYNIVTENFGEKYLLKTLIETEKENGKILLAEENGEIIGLVVGIINNEKEETFDFSVPKRGKITELIVSEKYRFEGVGKKLLGAMEGYLKSVGCEGVMGDVFAYNENAKKFYRKNGYFSRNIEMMKKV